jgi:hypothetical protein
LTGFDERELGRMSTDIFNSVANDFSALNYPQEILSADLQEYGQGASVASIQEHECITSAPAVSLASVTNEESSNPGSQPLDKFPEDWMPQLTVPLRSEADDGAIGSYYAAEDEAYESD